MAAGQCCRQQGIGWVQCLLQRKGACSTVRTSFLLRNKPRPMNSRSDVLALQPGEISDVHVEL